MLSRKFNRKLYDLVSQDIINELESFNAINLTDVEFEWNISAKYQTPFLMLKCTEPEDNDSLILSYVAEQQMLPILEKYFDSVELWDEEECSSTDKKWRELKITFSDAW